MTKDVLVSISGLQFEIDEDEAVEVITAGEYFNRNGKHFVLFEELSEEDRGVTKNTIKISDKQVDIMKKGVNNVHMVFEENKQNMTYYNTPFGDLMIQINTTSLSVKEEENEMLVQIKYDLNVNYSYVSECLIQIKVKSKRLSE
ncbi:uncharacterized beta-barrel protein YwiB (DUF1934 family) [Mobilisporobacter senegalensis]|uniref:Uncharacterized beta-barrel protein YwiB (DUF1934 family) n=1 Tax=Mobilisporobacter senegalensis TaxID=1329262 RepID=A0A3N1XHY7_9FIRM|nr:DUF1934 domain-containing protein [Mobilisporobacter senegalensis]ROR25751.1 uncharacterized beta-barrel protein YwiB (DUF1934 family) [Mobilisporobacter senegalensis]